MNDFFLDEQWRPVPNYPDYDVSDYGRVYSHRRGRLLSIHNNQGYCCVNLSNHDGWRQLRVHRLVALAFISGHFEGAFVNHIDGDKQNNHVDNLEWVTHQENVNHAKENGLIKKNYLRSWIWDEEKQELIEYKR